MCLTTFLIDCNFCFSIFLSSISIHVSSYSHCFRLSFLKPRSILQVSVYVSMKNVSVFFYGVSDVYEGFNSYFSVLNRNRYFINVLFWIWFFNWQDSGHFLCQVLLLPRRLVINSPPPFFWLRCGLLSIWFFTLPFGEVYAIVCISLCWNKVISTVELLFRQRSLSLSPLFFLFYYPCHFPHKFSDLSTTFCRNRVFFGSKVIPPV